MQCVDIVVNIAPDDASAHGKFAPEVKFVQENDDTQQ
jgi:hypothetical protein